MMNQSLSVGGDQWAVEVLHSPRQRMDAMQLLQTRKLRQKLWQNRIQKRILIPSWILQKLELMTPSFQPKHHCVSLISSALERPRGDKLWGQTVVVARIATTQKIMMTMIICTWVFWCSWFCWCWAILLCSPLFPLVIPRLWALQSRSILGTILL